MFFFRRKKLSPSDLPPADGVIEQSTQQQPSSSESQSPSQQNQQSHDIYPWSAQHLNLLPPNLLNKNAPSSGPSPSPFPRYGPALPATATADGKLFLFGGLVSESGSNDLYVFSTEDLSACLLQTSGDVPSPRVGHAGALVNNDLLIWGGDTNLNRQEVINEPPDNSLYLLNLVSREWTHVVTDGSRPVGRYGHVMAMVGSKLVVFGGQINGEFLNDMWAFDLNSLQSKPFWESYEPVPGNEKPFPRTGHASVAYGDCITIFGGTDGQYHYNDTWSFNVSTRKWTELRCTGFIPPPREGHAAALVDDVMYIFGGRGVDGNDLDDLTAFNLSTHRWFIFQNMGPGPSGRSGHALASHGTRVFVLGGLSSAGPQAGETMLIDVLDTKHLKYPKLEPNAVNPTRVGLYVGLWNVCGLWKPKLCRHGVRETTEC